MIYDVRTYECKPGTLNDYLSAYKSHGYAPQTRHLGKPFFYAITETGVVNTFMHIWAFESVADRALKRAAMWGDPEWVAYIKMVREMGYLIRQENKLMTPTDFFAEGAL